MPGTVSVRVLGARELPIMDRAADTTDAFVEIIFGDNVRKTEICQKTLTPSWADEEFVFESEDQELQNESLVFRVMDYDTYSANDPIGRVYVNLNPLIEAAYHNHVSSLNQLASRNKERTTAVEDGHPLNQAVPANSFSADFKGWLPIIDTLHGHRGDLQLEISLELLHDANQLRQHSCGVTFSVGSHAPPGTDLLCIHGLVDDIITSGDPEYQWMDRIRTPRATNDQRQMKLADLASQTRRKVGMKAIEMGANAVLGYNVKFDLEGESTGVVCVRSTGTAVTIQHNVIQPVVPTATNNHKRSDTYSFAGSSTAAQILEQRARRSRSRSESRDVMANGADNKLISVPPLISSQSSTTSATITTTDHKHSRPDTNNTTYFSGGRAAPPLKPFPESGDAPWEAAYSNRLHQQQMVPLLSIDVVPDGMIVAHGGVVCARSVKILTEVTGDKESKKCYADAADARAVWWNELRSEILSHMKSLNCNYVIAYTEDITIDEEVCIMSAMGTAVVCSPLDYFSLRHQPDYITDEHLSAGCAPCHLPYTEAQLPFSAILRPCSKCSEASVCDFLLSSASVDQFSDCIINQPVPVQTHVVHHLSNCTDEVDEAVEISQLLPFLEHQVHDKLMGEYLLGAHEQGCNALLGVRVLIMIAQTSVMAVINAYAVNLTPLIVDRQSSRSGDGSSVTSPRASTGGSKKLDLANDKNAMCLVLQPDAKHKNRNSGSFNEHPTNGTTPASTRMHDKMSSLLSAAIRRNWSHRDVVGSVNTSNEHSEMTDMSLVPDNKFELVIWPNVPQAISSAANKTVSPPMQENASCASDKSSKWHKGKLNRIVNRFRRRHYENRHDFETALLVSDLALTVGIIQKNTNGSVGGSHDASRSHSTPQVVPVPVSTAASTALAYVRSVSASTTSQQQFHQCGLIMNVDTRCATLHAITNHISHVCQGELVLVSAHHCNQLFDRLDVSSRLIGCYDASFIRENSALKDKHDVELFIQTVLDEISHDLHSHVMSYGANCLLNLRITSNELFGAATKNQAQCLIGISGDMHKINMQQDDDNNDR